MTGGMTRGPQLWFGQPEALTLAEDQSHFPGPCLRGYTIPEFSAQKVTVGPVHDHRPNFVFFKGIHDRQRTLVIRIAAITRAGDSAITIARFRPSEIF